ncbi:hypothetical protein DGo_PA0156 (plasmid) [Deinococcus gobiensis I-0]|uniref:Uncharacterized protein n=1 Tax=Deinococcus gobiensis (strain DSM 21396 / JCM 16679 / CGMCC 1.7299 / I-0) TaxID=745776 RepID=H8H123_DEIGI|nr:hypothetical protein DGo_PA0156 [Deinococcus gobiensis I-0]
MRHESPRSWGRESPRPWPRGAAGRKVDGEVTGRPLRARTGEREGRPSCQGRHRRVACGRIGCPFGGAACGRSPLSVPQSGRREAPGRAGVSRSTTARAALGTGGAGGKGTGLVHASPGCCGVVGPVPSAALDSDPAQGWTHLRADDKSYQLCMWAFAKSGRKPGKSCAKSGRGLHRPGPQWASRRSRTLRPRRPP